MEETKIRSGEQLPPPAVCIAAAIFIVSSVLMAMDMIADILWRDTVMLNFGVLVWFVGTGLLACKMNALRWAKFLFGSGSVILFLMIGFMIFQLVRGDTQLSELAGLPEWVMFGIFFLLLIFGFWALNRHGVKEWFEAGEGGAVSAMILWPIVIVAMLFGASSLLSQWRNEQQLEAIYRYELTVFLEDAETRQELRNFSTLSQQDHSNRQRGFVPQMSSKSLPGERGGSGMKFTGMADAPVVFSVSSEGYEAKEITIDRDNNWDDLRIPLKRLHSEE